MLIRRKDMDEITGVGNSCESKLDVLFWLEPLSAVQLTTDSGEEGAKSVLRVLPVFYMWKSPVVLRSSRFSVVRATKSVFIRQRTTITMSHSTRTKLEVSTGRRKHGPAVHSLNYLCLKVKVAGIFFVILWLNLFSSGSATAAIVFSDLTIVYFEVFRRLRGQNSSAPAFF